MTLDDGDALRQHAYWTGNTGYFRQCWAIEAWRVSATQAGSTFTAGQAAAAATALHAHVEREHSASTSRVRRANDDDRSEAFRAHRDFADAAMRDLPPSETVMATRRQRYSIGMCLRTRM